MTAHISDLTFRTITGPAELGLFTRFPYQLNDEIEGDLGNGHRVPQWLWLALRGPGLIARAAWWAKPGDTAPQVLDILDLDDSAGPAAVDAAAALLSTAMAELVPAGTRPPDYIRFTEPGWRDDPAARLAVENRMQAAERTGARFFVERLRLEWRQGTPVPAPAGRLRFRPATDPAELLTLMTEVMDGTLDAHSRADLAVMSPRAGAAKHYDGELARYTSPRDWWQIAELPGGEPVGFVIPADNGYHPIIAYLGVRPAYRGNGYISDILAEGMRILVAAGAGHIHASTDLGNVPMAKAFHRAGWVTYSHQIDMTWPG